MPDNPSIKQALQKLGKTITPVVTPKEGIPLVTTKTTETTTATPTPQAPTR
jgi:hypothetical protein